MAQKRVIYGFIDKETKYMSERGRLNGSMAERFQMATRLRYGCVADLMAERA